MLSNTFHLGEEYAKTRLVTYILDTYRTNELRPLVVICPGGGFLDCSPYEGEPVAIAFNRAGYHAAVLTYSTEASNPGKSLFPQPLFDLADAICLIREHAATWHVDQERITILGFSAGGHLCASYGNLWNTSVLEKHGTSQERRPNSVILGYPLLDKRSLGNPGGQGDSELELQQITGQDKWVRYQDFVRRSREALLGQRPTTETLRLASPMDTIGPDTPPTFLWTTFGDHVLDPRQDLEYAGRLREAGIPCELHVFAEGEHGLALADRTCARKSANIDGHVAHWTELAVEWLER